MKVKKIASILFITASITWGCNQSGSEEKESNGNEEGSKLEQVQVPEKVQAPVQNEAQSGDADQYGRLPGDQHYGHDHPVETQQNQTNTQQQNLNGGPDKYGRNPGDEHYGHDHPPQNQPNQTNTQQQNLDGGPDKYGRNPGDEHYGHDHE